MQRRNFIKTTLSVCALLVPVMAKDVGDTVGVIGGYGPKQDPKPTPLPGNVIAIESGAHTAKTALAIKTMLYHDIDGYNMRYYGTDTSTEYLRKLVYDLGYKRNGRLRVSIADPKKYNVNEIDALTTIGLAAFNMDMAKSVYVYDDIQMSDDEFHELYTSFISKAEKTGTNYILVRTLSMPLKGINGNYIRIKPSKTQRHARAIYKPSFSTWFERLNYGKVTEDYVYGT